MFLSLYSVAILTFFFFFFNDTATTEIYTLSLHDALPIFVHFLPCLVFLLGIGVATVAADVALVRSEEHTSELQSLAYLVCRLLLEKKKKKNHPLCIVHVLHVLNHRDVHTSPAVSARDARP